MCVSIETALMKGSVTIYLVDGRLMVDDFFQRFS